MWRFFEKGVIIGTDTILREGCNYRDGYTAGDKNRAPSATHENGVAEGATE